VINRWCIQIGET